MNFHPSVEVGDVAILLILVENDIEFRAAIVFSLRFEEESRYPLQPVSDSIIRIIAIELLDVLRVRLLGDARLNGSD